jgi:hypothetical protein
VKLLLCLLFFQPPLLFLINNLSAEVYPIAPGDWTILKNKDNIYEKCDGIWMPGYNDAAIALKAVFKYISDLPRNNAEKNYILVNRKLFRAQFAGLIKGSNKEIFCNFFDRRMNAKQWKSEQVLTEDTEFYSWSMIYDPVKKICLSFTVNGRKLTGVIFDRETLLWTMD